MCPPPPSPRFLEHKKSLVGIGLIKRNISTAFTYLWDFFLKSDWLNFHPCINRSRGFFLEGVLWS